MKSWRVECVRWHPCASQRQYREVGTTLADTMWDAVCKAQEEFAHVAEDDEEIVVYCLPDAPTRFELIDALP